MLEHIIQETDGEWVGVCLDTANSLGAGEGLSEVVRVLSPYVLNLHIKDVIIERVDHMMGFTVRGCPAGQGIVDITGLLQAIRQHGRCGSAILELWSNPESTIQATLKKEKQWFESYYQLPIANCSDNTCPAMFLRFLYRCSKPAQPYELQTSLSD